MDHPKDQPHAIAHVLQPTLWAKTRSGSRCQLLAMGWCRMHGDLRPALRRGIRSSARHGRRCGAACPVLALLRRADPAEWPLCAAGPTGRRNTGVKSLCWCFKLQGLTWSFVYPPNAGIEGLAAVRSVVVGRATPLRFFFLCHADVPRQGPSDESSQEFHDESQKFDSSTCGVEMLACSETLPALPVWRALAGPVTFGQGRKPAEPGARTARAFTGWHRSGPMATSRSPCW